MRGVRRPRLLLTRRKHGQRASNQSGRTQALQKSRGDTDFLLERVDVAERRISLVCHFDSSPYLDWIREVQRARECREAACINLDRPLLVVELDLRGLAVRRATSADR